jgi:regulator of sirC expression with transglutaminase-like and TPR domain
LLVAHSILTPAEKEALLALLDDPSAAVRRGLKQRFTTLGPAARDLLTAAADGSNRALAWHARTFLTELHFTDPIGDFLTFIRSLNYELETGSMILARTVHPQLDAGVCCEALDAIAARCRQLILEPSSARDKCRVINRVLYHELGYAGNVENYTDPNNSLIDQVLVHRKGIPISLSIVYLLIGARLGLELEPIGLPGHFMVGCFLDHAPFFIDAFDGGFFRSPEDIFAFLRAAGQSPGITDLAPTPIREVLCRCCRNLANHYAIRDDHDHAEQFDRFVAEFESTYTKNCR